MLSSSDYDMRRETIKKSGIFLVAIFTFVVGISGISEAGVIVDFFSERATFVTGFFPSVNDDNALGSALPIVRGEGRSVDFNWLLLIKEYETPNIMDLFFRVENSGGTTEYFFIEGVANFTGLTWSDYHIELGTEEQGEFTPLSKTLGPGSGLDFDTPDKDPTPRGVFVTGFDEEGIPLVRSIFSTMIHTEERIWFEDGELPPHGPDPELSELAFFIFSLDVPDLGSPDLGYSFVIHQYPSFGEAEVIPEPASMVLLGSGFLGMIGMKFKGRIGNNFSYSASGLC